MKTKIVCLILIGLISKAVFASDETCYDISLKSDSWSRTPEVLCVTSLDANRSEFEISLKSGFPLPKDAAVTFHYQLLRSVRCMDENQNLFGIVNPTNSALNALAIQFNGKKDLEKKTESGVVTIGKTSFYYRNR